MVVVSEQAQHGVRRQTKFELDVLGMCVANICIESDPVSDGRHHRLRGSDGPARRVELREHAPCVSARVGGVVVSAVVVDGPVRELLVAVAQHAVRVEEVDHAELSGSQLDSALRET